MPTSQVSPVYLRRVVFACGSGQGLHVLGTGRPVLSYILLARNACTFPVVIPDRPVLTYVGHCDLQPCRPMQISHK